MCITLHCISPFAENLGMLKNNNGFAVKYIHHLFIFALAFSLGRGTRPAPLEQQKIPRVQHQFQLILLAPQQDGTNQGRKCSHFTWALDKL